MENEKAARAPSLDAWLAEAKAQPGAEKSGMYLFHNGVVRETPRAEAREGLPAQRPVTGMRFDYDAEAVRRAVEEACGLPGINHVRVWLNRGELKVGDDLMLVLVGGDIRPRVIAALESLVETLKTRCVTEVEL